MPGRSSSSLLSHGRGRCRQAPRRRPITAATDGGQPCAPVRRRAAAAGADQRSRCVASAEAIARPSVIAAAEAESRCVASAEAIAGRRGRCGASRGAATDTRGRSTRRYWTASRVGRESGAGGGRDLARPCENCRLAVCQSGSGRPARSGRPGQRRPRRISGRRVVAIDA